MFTVNLLEHSAVLLLEDSPMRIAWFEKQIPNLKVVKTVQEFVDYFETRPVVDFIFWDHDLGDGGDGFDAAKFLTDRFGSGSRYGLIHSWNRAGAQRMQTLLTGTPHVPFGDFEIKIG